jgi:hypothetical protein
MNELQKGWVDSIFIVFDKGNPNEVVMDVTKDGYPARRVTLLVSDFWDKQFWFKLSNATGIIPAVPGTLTCPVCKAKRVSFLRNFRGHYFCGFCGTHLKLDNGHLTIIARADGSTS